MIAVAIISSCTGERRARNFISTFANAVEQGQTQVIAEMYPQIHALSEQNFNIDALKDPDLKIIKGKEKGETVFQTSDGTKIFVSKGSDNSLQITRSIGLLVVDPKLKNFALKTGMVDDETDDVTIHLKLADKAFINWVAKDFLKDIKKKVTARYSDSITPGLYYFGHGTKLIVTNKSDIDIPAEAYTAISKFSELVHDDDGLGKILDSTVKNTSLPIKAGDSVVLRRGGEWDHWWAKVSIQFNEDVLIDLFLSTYTPTGTEYEEYSTLKEDAR